MAKRVMDSVIKMPWSSSFPVLLLLMVSSSSSVTDDACPLCSCSDYGTSIDCSTNQLNTSNPFADIDIAPEVTSMVITGGDIEEDRPLELRDSVLGRSFPNLRSLHFSTCSIGMIEDDAFEQMPYLEELIFYKNGLQNIPRALKLLANSLNKLEITSQGKLFDAFSGLNEFNNLTILDISSNSIRYLERRSFMGLSKLETLSLWNNNIENIDYGVFIPIVNLKTLDLSHNKLRFIPSAIKSLIHLQELDSSYNNISDVHNFEFITYMPNLTTLKLQGNVISIIDGVSVDFLLNSSTLVDIRLCNNPYRCNKTLCRFMYFYTTYLSFSPFDGLDPFRVLPIKCTYYCGSPLGYFGNTLGNVYGELCTIGLPIPTSVPEVVQKNRKSVRVIAIVLGVLIAVGVAFGFMVYFALRRLGHLRRGFIFAGQGFVKFNNNRRNADIVFDALVYSHVHETHFVDDRLRPRLEDPPNDFRLCLPLTRDFRLGGKKLNNLRESMMSSRCAIFVISEAFIQDARCKQALEVACEFLHRDDLGPAHLKQTGLILIVLDPVLLDQLPETLRVLVDRLVTLEWNNFDEERCWKRLEQALEQFREQNEI